MAKNVAATTKAKEVNAAAKKIASTKVAPYKHKSTGEDQSASSGTRTGRFAPADSDKATIEGMKRAAELAERGMRATEASSSEGGVDTIPPPVVESGVSPQPPNQENLMGTTEVVKTKTKQDADSEAAQAKIAEKAKKAADKAKAKADADAAAAIKKAERDAKAAEAKAVRDAKAAELVAAGHKYVGSMLALAERVKSGVYVKSTTGQLRSNDDIAIAFDAVPPQNVVKLGTLLFGEANKYAALNIGQQSMNYRNRLRGAVRKGDVKFGEEVITIDLIKAKIVELGLDTGKAEAEARAAAKAEREAKAAAAKAAKVDKPAKPVVPVPAQPAA